MNNNNNKVKRGDIFYYDFGTKEGSIQSGIRPVRFLRQKQNEKHGLLWPCFDGTRSSVICA